MQEVCVDEVRRLPGDVRRVAVPEGVQGRVEEVRRQVRRRRGAVPDVRGVGVVPKKAPLWQLFLYHLAENHGYLSIVTQYDEAMPRAWRISRVSSAGAFLTTNPPLAPTGTIMVFLTVWAFISPSTSVRKSSRRSDQRRPPRATLPPLRWTPSTRGE